MPFAPPAHPSPLPSDGRLHHAISKSETWVLNKGHQKAYSKALQCRVTWVPGSQRGMLATACVALLDTYMT